MLRKLKEIVGLSPSPGSRREPMPYTDRELLERMEEFNRNADTHWQSIRNDPAGRSPGRARESPWSPGRPAGKKPPCWLPCWTTREVPLCLPFETVKMAAFPL